MQAYINIVEFCKYPIDDSELRFHIQLLTLDDFLFTDEDGNSLFLKTIELSGYHSGQRCSHVMRLLIKQAEQLDTNMALVVYLLSHGNKHNFQPLQKILDMSSVHNRAYHTDDVGITFFNILNQWTQSPEYNLTDDINYFKITKSMLKQAFSCKHKTIRDQFLTFYHHSISNNSLLLVELQELYLHSDMGGFRLFDTLIISLPQENLVTFYQELRYLHQQGWITQKKHEDILYSHALGKVGYSPMHEMISTNCEDKILDYVNEVIYILRPQQLKAALTQKNKNRYTAMQQGVNNGLDVASPRISRLFLSLIDPDSGVFTLDECVKMVSKRLRCINTKTNSSIVNHEIRAKKNSLLMLHEQQNINTSFFGYGAARSTLMYFKSDPESKLIEPPLERGIVSFPTF